MRDLGLDDLLGEEAVTVVEWGDKVSAALPGVLVVGDGTGLVIPGLVNAHTHLELSALRGAVPGGAGFVPWVERLIGMRVEVGNDEWRLLANEPDYVPRKLRKKAK